MELAPVAEMLPASVRPDVRPLRPDELQRGFMLQPGRYQLSEVWWRRGGHAWWDAAFAECSSLVHSTLLLLLAVAPPLVAFPHICGWTPALPVLHELLQFQPSWQLAHTLHRRGQVQRGYTHCILCSAA